MHHRDFFLSLLARHHCWLHYCELWRPVYWPVLPREYICLSRTCLSDQSARSTIRAHKLTNNELKIWHCEKWFCSLVPYCQMLYCNRTVSAICTACRELTNKADQSQLILKVKTISKLVNKINELLTIFLHNNKVQWNMKADITKEQNTINTGDYWFYWS